MPAYNSLTDLELIDALRSGDTVSYTELYNRYFRLLYGYAYKKLRDKEQSKDLIQNFFTTLWLKRQEIQIDHSVSGYFFTIINRRIIDYFLHKEIEHKYIESFAAFLPAETIETDHLVREKQLLHFIEKEIQSLPARMRKVFELSRKEHLTHKEIAIQMGIAESTVDRQISNALSILRARLGIIAWIVLLIRF